MSPLSGDSPRARRVLLADSCLSIPGLAAELRRRGYNVLLQPDRTAVPRVLAAETVIAVLMESAADPIADSTLLLRILEADARISVLILGNKLDANAVTSFLHKGAALCITDSLDPVVLADRMERAVTLRDAELATTGTIGHLRASLREVNKQLGQEGVAMRQRWVGSLAALVRLAEASHVHMAGHSLRVSDLAGAIAVAMGHTDAEVETIRLAGRLHDLGMIGVPARIIDKPGPLSEEEYALVRQHPAIASDILGSFPNFAEITRGIRGHHEHWDGTGYPDGLAGDQIPRISLILAAAEVFDALVSPRPYKRAEDHVAAMERIREISGRILDPAVCEALGAVVSGRKTLPFLPEARTRMQEFPAARAWEGEGVPAAVGEALMPDYLGEIPGR